jgi:RimJ/RimL family protein N-acetyltransferase
LLTDLDLMRLHVEAELTHDVTGDLVATNEPSPATAPRFFLGHTALGVVRRFRRDVSEARRRALEIVQLDPRATTDSPLDPTAFERILSDDAPVEHTSIGLAFRFPRAPASAPNTRILRDPADAAVLHPLLASWAPDITASAPLVALVRDGQAVAVCASVRITPLAHEAGVETAAEFRGRGYAKAVVAAWSTAVRALGVEPVYSTTWQNTASRALARSLGLEAVGRDLHIR